MDVLATASGELWITEGERGEIEALCAGFLHRMSTGAKNDGIYEKR